MTGNFALLQEGKSKAQEIRNNLKNLETTSGRLTAQYTKAQNDINETFQVDLYNILVMAYLYHFTAVFFRKAGSTDGRTLFVSSKPIKNLVWGLRRLVLDGQTSLNV